MRDRGRFDPIDLEALKADHPLSGLFEQHGFKVRGPRGGHGFCSCPWHPERSGSCHVDDRKGYFHCFGCGVSGDHFDALQHFRGITFVQAVEELGGVRPVSPEDRRRFEERQREIDERARADRAKAKTKVEALFERAKPIAGTHAAAYLAARGLKVAKAWTFDLRFAPELPYWGFADREATELTNLAATPAMLAAIRDVDGNLIGLHRTWLDPERPEKLSPPGDRSRNPARKVLGDMAGGMIRLSPIGPRLAIGEGIETSRSWYALGLGGDDVSIAAAVSLGNMAGRALASRRHPTDDKRRIMAGGPDPEAPGVILPDVVREVVLIGDGDSNAATTRSTLMIAGERFRQQGRKVSVAMAPDGSDFNDLLSSDGGDVPDPAPVRTFEEFEEDSRPILAPRFISKFGATWLHEITGRKPVRNWLVKDLLLAGTFGIVFGPPGCGKSFLMADMCLTLATAGEGGRPEWFGYRGRRAGIIYVVAEGSDDFTIRMHAWRQAHNVADDLVVPFVFLPTSVDLRSSDEQAKRLADEIVALSAQMLERCGVKTELVVIDTVARALAGGNENDSAVMGAFVINCGLIQTLTGAAVIGVHHGGKEAGRGPRGHEALHGAADLEIEAAGAIDGNPNVWTVRKFKAGPAGAAHPFRLRPIEVGKDEDGDAITSCVLVSKMGDSTEKSARGRPFYPKGENLALLKAMEQTFNNTVADVVMRSPDMILGGKSERVKDLVKTAAVKQVFEDAMWSAKSGEDDDVTRRKIGQAFSRAIGRLSDAGVIGSYKGLLFFTGVSIQGVKVLGVEGVVDYSNRGDAIPDRVDDQEPPMFADAYIHDIVGDNFGGRS